MNDVMREVLGELGLVDRNWQESSYCPGVLEATIPGGEPAIETWAALRDRYGETGYWPILRGEILRSESPKIADAPSPPPIDVEAVLARVPRGTVAEVLDAYRAREWEAINEGLRLMNEKLRSQGRPELPVYNHELVATEEDNEHEDESCEPWPQEPMSGGALQLTGVFDLRMRTPLGACGIALVSARHPAHAPAHLGFGGWNEVPRDEVLVAIFLDWNRRFGAVPAVITHDVVEFSVDRPPQTEMAAMALAREHSKLCSDIVSQGVGSILHLGMILWQSPQWYFWWD